MSDTTASPWLTIVGLGEDGLSGLSDASRSALKDAQIIFGGPRHLDLVQAGPRGQAWPVPFSTSPVIKHRGSPVVVLASGDPFWFGAGGSLMRDLAPEEWVSHPAPSCFSLAASALGWKLEESQCLGLHAAPFEHLRPVLSRGVKLLCTLRDAQVPQALADWLTQNDHGDATLHILERLGGPAQSIHKCAARAYQHTCRGAPVLAAIEATSAGLPRASGLSDHHFQNDGQITKRPIRALTLSALAPRPNELLWDIGGGSGSISVEWCLSAPAARAITFEVRADRLKNIQANAALFGLSHRIFPVLGSAPDILKDIETPDCVFVGGGGSKALFAHLWQILPVGTRIVANGVTLETETVLMTAHQDYGGHLLKVDLSEVAALGRMRAWDRSRPVIQWSVTR
ncbi:precorrin-6Y C5,15-methyltransferase (decarboxylating) [Epibacterium ulvae]|uniref:Precorrin-6Y C5,15-methyltransferase (Decarboxylating) n=1 Tax=Epibacterium ulvae TaxID=1156985 RepID=A0A1G5R629_9RHOB|nr:precorrin-6y C5,15-methyltransferase (decarboxylating) subunit CbiE [Epibacterium ulvae]SCZ68881.1 precorrin-6Y C5,15-methyltransferase (decarboxylating) [Epibacterium ulvae]